MKKICKMIFSLGIIFVFPALLFAGDWITQGLQDLRTDPVRAISSGVGAVTGAISSGISGTLGAVYNAGYDTGAVLKSGYNTHIAPTLDRMPSLRYTGGTSNWGQTLGSNLLGINQPLFGTSVNGSEGNDLKSNLSTAQENNRALTGWSDNTSPSISGKNAMDLAINPQGKIE
jgi:hypothetical protein